VVLPGGLAVLLRVREVRLIDERHRGDLADHRQQALASGRLVDRRVKDEVLVGQLTQPVVVARQLVVPVAAALQRLEVGRRQLLGGELGGVALEHRADRVDLVQVLAVEVPHDRRAVRRRLDEPFAAQKDERLAYGRAADAELAAELLLAERLTWRELAGHDGLAQHARGGNARLLPEGGSGRSRWGHPVPIPVADTASRRYTASNDVFLPTWFGRIVYAYAILPGHAW
jgi:hypothetical protein